MQRLGKNIGGYRGEKIDITRAVRDVQEAALRAGWKLDSSAWMETCGLLALHRPVTLARKRVYISSGMHGDEPAGPLAVLRLLQEDSWPSDFELWACPCLNPSGFSLHRRENAAGIDLNRDYRRLQTPEIRAHTAWLEQRPRFDLTLCLHEDWEANGFYLYELNPDNRPSSVDRIIQEVSKICLIDTSPLIEGRPASNGIIRPEGDPLLRPEWPEAIYLIANKTRQSYTLEAPSDFPLETRIAALATATRVALERIDGDS
jgi:murein peptide amidase A